MLVGKKKTLLINSDQAKRLAVKMVEDVPVDEGFSLSLGVESPRRSVAQNRLLWLWNTESGEYFGCTKEEMHTEFKGIFLVQIYERDDPEYAEMVNAVRSVWNSGLYDEAKFLRKAIIDLTSTTRAKTKQFSEYLTSIDRWCVDQGLFLTHPDYYDFAINEKG